MPDLVICISGKRKSGKDFVATRLCEELNKCGASCSICSISAPLKEEFARLHGLDAELLKSSGEYKERFRLAMVAWSDALREVDPACFCRKAIATCSTPIGIVSDCRRRTDLLFFRQHYRTLLLRVSATQTVRESRGFAFVTGVDDAETECDLDDWPEWDWQLTNNDDVEQFESDLQALMQRVLSMR